ncbi:TPA: hypothetical protein ACTW52_001436 [Klebsiella quasipneumoniae subsp. similipneumoniae]|nr:hypothetical protein [Klebsiella quasipneumoniae]HBR1908301.1 hypothetical protein [Klebsiella quasipneumoniae subsp. similipneumoniae]MDV5690040.1 hypothetical protein [Klebsiella quasipneumoniae]MEB5582003.1 hypothetical protein [Klebsiella quasipneumoniae]MEB5746598.1 hypothetical protein [Klebsiella quasipneumoniae]HCB0672608.1 hypothetical protein [Klebsiella quasipneumoniae subsp. similipneumoniae]
MNQSRREFIAKTTSLLLFTKFNVNIALASDQTYMERIEKIINSATNINLNKGQLKILYGNIRPNGLDQTSELQKEINGIKNNTIYIMHPGVFNIKSIIIPSLENVIFIFTGVTFKLLQNTSPLDHEMVRFTSLKNSIVCDLKTDGNRDNAIDTNLNDPSWYGRCLNWRLGDNSKNVYFSNTTMLNALYCGSQWGKNINNVILDGIKYDNIGEHVFYISGKGGGNNSNITFRNIEGGSLGINPRNRIKKHETFFLKSAQSIGPNSNFTIYNANFSPTKKASYAGVLICTGDLIYTTIKKVKINGNIDAVIYPYNDSSFVTMDDITLTSDNSHTRLIYSYVKNVKIIKWKASNLNFEGSITKQPYMQLFTSISDSTFSILQFSEVKASTFHGIHNTELNNVKFTNPIEANELNTIITFLNCNYQPTKQIRKFKILNQQDTNDLFEKIKNKDRIIKLPDNGYQLH